MGTHYLQEAWQLTRLRHSGYDTLASNSLQRLCSLKSIFEIAWALIGGAHG